MLLESKGKLYSYLGHVVESQIDFSELFPPAQPDVPPSICIKLDRSAAAAGTQQWCHHWKTADGSITLSLAKNNDNYCLEVPGAARFEVSADGKHLICSPEPSTPHAVTRHFLLDQILPRIFAHFYTYNVFHGSCVARGNRGICFLGDTGRGKSTLAAGFFKAGYRVLTDDCIRVFLENGEVYGIPNYPGLRLLHDSLARLNFVEFEQREAGAALKEKSRVLLSHPELSTVKITEICILDDPENGEKGGDVEKVEVSKGRAVQELLRNSFSLDLSDTRYLEKQFFQISGLVSSGVPISILRYPRSYENIPEIIQVVERG